MPYLEDDLLPISALAHLLFCERRCALVHVEQVWAENRFTIEGQHLHARTHQQGDELRGGVWIVRGLPLRSLALGLVGKADVVEFEPPGGRDPTNLAPSQLSGHVRETAGAGWRITPVEYKRGRPKKDPCDRVQLCAQALCLEEMLGVQLSAGAIFYGRRRRRTEVCFDGPLRELVASTAQRLHELVASGRTPPARREPKCENCSLVHLCLPGAVRPGRSAAAFTQRQLDRHLMAPDPETEAFDQDEAL